MASLRELLEEQQEQFLLHVENGHSERNLKSYAKILRRALYRIVHWKIIRKVWHWAPENGRWKVFSCFSDMGSEALAMKFERLSCSGVLITSDREVQRKYGEENHQLSPVSVLALHSDDDSAVCSYSAAEDNSSASYELEELFSCPYPHTTKDKREWNQRNNVVLEFLKELEGRICDPSQIIRLVGMDFLSSIREWSNYQNEMQEIGREIEGAIFEEIRDEFVEDMMDSH